MQKTIRKHQPQLQSHLCFRQTFQVLYITLRPSRQSIDALWTFAFLKGESVTTAFAIFLTIIVEDQSGLLR